MVQYKVHKKEKIYFSIRLVISLFVFLLFIGGLIGLSHLSATLPFDFFSYAILYIVIIIILSFLRQAIFIGLIQANSVLLSKEQFPEVYAVVEEYSEKLELNRIPKIYLIESGGALNAFATRLMRRNYVVLYSELLEEYYEGDKTVVEFVIAHELGHIERKHMSKAYLLMFSNIVPFLHQAYSRACEYTCDNIGYALSPEGAPKGILAISAGRGLYKRMNQQAFIKQYTNDQSFWRWFVSKLSSHPMSTLRLKNVLPAQNFTAPSATISAMENQKATDHNRFMPQ